MEHQQQMNKLLLDEKERLVEHLQKELSEVKRFLGLANFYRRHLRDMGMISMPLTALTR